MPRHDASLPPAPAVTEYRTPIGRLDVRGDFLAPLLQAGGSGVIVALAGAVLAWRLDGDVLTVAIVCGTLGLTVHWVLALILSQRLLWSIERRQGVDLDGDGYAGEPLLINPDAARTKAARERLTAEKAAHQAALIEFVQRCAARRATSENALGIKPSKRAEYVRMREQLFGLGLAEWKDKRNTGAGWRLTVAPGKAEEIIRQHVT